MLAQQSSGALQVAPSALHIGDESGGASEGASSGTSLSPPSGTQRSARAPHAVTKSPTKKGIQERMLGITKTKLA
jgi:hypothetical protein